MGRRDNHNAQRSDHPQAPSDGPPLPPSHTMQRSEGPTNPSLMRAVENVANPPTPTVTPAATGAEEMSDEDRDDDDEARKLLCLIGVTDGRSVNSAESNEAATHELETAFLMGGAEESSRLERKVVAAIDRRDEALENEGEKPQSSASGSRTISNPTEGDSIGVGVAVGPEELGLPGAYAVGGVPGEDAEQEEEDEEADDDEDDAGEDRINDPVLQGELVEENGNANQGGEGSTRSTSSVHDAAPESAVIEGQKEEPTNNSRWFILSLTAILLLLAVVVLLSVGLGGGFESNTNNPPPHTMAPSLQVSYEVQDAQSDMESADSPTNNTLPPTLSTLERIQQRGHLTTIYFPMSGPKENHEITGRVPDLARTIAAAIFGEPKIDFIPVSFHDVFELFLNGTVDLMLEFTHTMERDIFMSAAQAPFASSVPYRYDGTVVAGDPFYVECAENGMNHINECSGIRVCTQEASIHYTAMKMHLPERQIVQVGFAEGGIYGGLIRGECNIIAGAQLVQEFVSTQSWNGTYIDMDNFEIGQTYFSRDPVCVTTRRDDTEFSDFVNAVLLGLMAAEQQNITQSTAHVMPQTSLFGEEYQDMFRNAVAFAGNFAEQSQRVPGFPRTALEHLNNGSTGLLYPHPFGDVENGRDELPLGDNLRAILRRGQLRCGVLMDRLGFATRVGEEYHGMDIDFCRSVAAALFGGQIDTVVFVEVEQDADGYTLLASKEIDMLAGATWTLEADVREPTTGQGFSFSPPYFYGHSESKDNLCLATTEEDSDWAAFVHWVVTSTFHAEDNELNSSTFNEMPEVFLFGPELRHMFRSSVLAMGSYADIYKRNLGGIITRGGRNVLNGIGKPGPQQYVNPGW